MWPLKDIIHKSRKTVLSLTHMNNCLARCKTLIKFTHNDYKSLFKSKSLIHMIDVDGECCWPSTILLAINTHCHLISSKQLSSNRFRFDKTRASSKYLATAKSVCQKTFITRISNIPAPPITSPTIGSTFRVLNSVRNSWKGTILLAWDSLGQLLCRREEANATPHL